MLVTHQIRVHLVEKVQYLEQFRKANMIIRQRKGGQENQLPNGHDRREHGTMQMM
jgi:hypothetical protein